MLLISSSDIFNLEFLTTLKQFHEDLENSVPLLKEVSLLANAPYIEPVDSGVRVGGFLDNLPWAEEEAQQYRQWGHSYPGFQNLYFTLDGKHAIVVIKRRRSRRFRPIACDCGVMPGVSTGPKNILPLWNNRRYHK